MAVEHHPEEVEHLALLPFGGREHLDGGSHPEVVLGEARLHPDPEVPLGRPQVVSHPDPRVSAGPVGAREVGQERASEVVLVAERSERVQEPFAVHCQRDLAPGQEHVVEGALEARGQVLGGHVSVPRFEIFSWSRRIPYISISGRGGHPGT